MVDFNLAFFQFIWECNSENIIKIGPYLPKLLQEKFGAVFLAHPVCLPDAEKLAFRSLSVNISKTVADTAKVTIND